MTTPRANMSVVDKKFMNDYTAKPDNKMHPPITQTVIRKLLLRRNMRDRGAMYSRAPACVCVCEEGDKKVNRKSNNPPRIWEEGLKEVKKYGGKRRPIVERKEERKDRGKG